MRRRSRLLLVLFAFVLSAAGVVGGYKLLRPGAPALTARLLFGPSERPVLVGVRGADFLIDRDGDGRFGADERFPLHGDASADTGVEIADPDGRTRYAVHRASTHDDKDTGITYMMVRVTVRGPAEYEQYCDVPIAPGGTALAHFGGPLMVDVRRIREQIPPGLKLVRGGEPTDLNALVGTIDPARGVWTVLVSEKVTAKGDGVEFGSTFPDGVRPVADIAFPPATPGGPPVKRRFTLDAVC